jgi:chromosome segregation protein
MFKLQRLEITGFKSFADYTEIVFTGSGITAVVGPNGCGKSNVSESIAWVLGEQRAKALRGAEMKDVVFQGTRSRKPSGMAEVVLHLVRDEEAVFSDEEDLSGFDEALSDLDEHAVQIEDFNSLEIEFEPAEISTFDAQTSINENGFHAEESETVQVAQVGSVKTVQQKTKPKRHWRPRNFALDYAPGEAISVTRRLYLSGESEYQLNGKTCRLRDIQDLFAGTGLSGAHYAIIEQGRIGQILSAKPSDRRNLIEEAAGISKFRTRQRAAETRLESAKTNLSRISDIVSEIDKQASALRRQAAKTRRYKLLREEFRILLRQLFAAEGRYLSELVDELENKLTEAVTIERRLFAEVAEKDEAFRAATTEARTTEENLAALRQTHAENALERDRASREHRYQTEQVAQIENRRAVLSGEIDSAETRRKLLTSELERLAADERSERAEAERSELALREAETKYREKSGELNKIETELEKERGEHLRHSSAVERFAEIERQLENNLERLGERAEGLERESARAEENRREHRAEAENLAADVAAEKEKLKNLHAEKQNILAEAAQARAALRGAEDVLKNLRNEFSRKRNRLETLRELEEKRAVYAPQVQNLFAAQAKIGVEFAGTLADKLNVEEKAERAVENLFGSYLQSVVVNSEADARKTIAFLNENKIGRIGVLVFNAEPRRRRTINDGNSEKVNDRKLKMMHFLGVSDDFAETLAEIFPREMAARLVEDLTDAKAESSEILVDYAGNLLIGGKFFVGGKASGGEKNDSLLAFKRELRELEKDARRLENEAEKAEIETEKTRSVLAETEEKILDLQSLIVKNERDLLGLEIREKTARQEIERAERHQKVVTDETAQIEKELAQLKQKRTEAVENARKAETARDETARNLKAIAANLTAKRREIEAENAALNEKRTLAATSGERRRSAQAALNRVEAEEKELALRVARQNLEIIETENKIKNLRDSINEIVAKIASSENEQTREHNELDEATAKLKSSRETADAMSAELADLNKRSAEARNERAALEIRQTEAMTTLRGVNEKCARELNLPLIELVENETIEADFDLESARAAAEDLREKLENFGAINMLALEELSEAEERLQFLTAQRQDIIDGITAAESALKEIKERSREKFKQAFTAINRNFVEFFQELFGGGRGEMTLLEAEDVLEAGIEIAAQPPGKRLQNILLLSGGEKAMTAIALVMAIFKYRPAPFCILDEVDAPLDDANVGRFVDKIASMAEKTQFIVITHNKRTMEAARALYGVTMQEAGISKVVSVKFD